MNYYDENDGNASNSADGSGQYNIEPPEAGSEIVCPSCGKEIDNDSKFCPYCGESIEKRCPACGGVVPKANRFCAKCGADTEIGNIETETTAKTDSYTEPVSAKTGGKNKILITAGVCVVILAAAAAVGYKPIMTYLENEKAYTTAEELYESGEYGAAMETFQALGNYKDSAQKADDCNTAIYGEALDAAIDLYNEGDYTAAITAFNEAASVIDTTEAAEWLEKCYEEVYQYALSQYNAENYTEANTYFGMISGYKDADEMAVGALAENTKAENYSKALDSYNAGDYEGALEVFNSLSGYKEADSYIESCNTKIVLSDCKRAYINYINELVAANNKDSQQNEYDFIYIDNDEIPELFVHGRFEAEGDRICTYYNGSVSEYPLNRTGGMSYMERGGLVCNFNGNSGYFLLNIYSLSNGNLTKIYSGLEAEEYDKDSDSFIISYEWEDVSVSEEEFNAKWNSVFDTSRAKTVANRYTTSEAISYLNSNF
ncbi:MAG: zinc ribbon domain-containing protein [Clostridiales bacterium]|nr:zinc ribbon domain-containing protein [Clostridiales bacterium]